MHTLLPSWGLIADVCMSCCRRCVVVRMRCLHAKWTFHRSTLNMIDPVWQLARSSLVAGLRNDDLKKRCFAEKRVGAVAWSRALYQSADQRLEDRIVFAVVQARRWTLQRFHDHKPCDAISDQLLPMRCGKCVMRIEEKDVVDAVCI